MGVVAEHVEARTGRREQDRVAGFGKVVGHGNRLIDVGNMHQANAAVTHGMLDQARISTEQHHSPGIFPESGRQRAEVLPLAIATGDQHHLLAQALEGGHRGTDIGAFRVVVEANPVGTPRHQFDPVRQPAEFTHRLEQRRPRQADRAAKSERRERVRGIVRAGQSEFGAGNAFTTRQHQRFAILVHDQAVFVGTERSIGAKPDKVTTADCHRRHSRIAPVKHHHAVSLENPRLRTPVMMYLFHRIEERLDGDPTMILIDEGWKALDDEVFAARIRDWLKTLRKRNALVGFATQSARDALESRISTALVEQTATMVFMPNSRARSEDYCDGFGLTEHELSIIRSLPAHSRCFLVRQPDASVVVRLDLSNAPEVLTILSGREASVRRLDLLREAVGDEPSEWYPALTGHTWPGLGPEAPEGGLWEAAE